MSKRDSQRSSSWRIRQRAGGLGVAVPAVMGVGALPAFAAHSGELHDDDVDMSVVSEGEESDEFGDALLISADEELEDGDLGSGDLVEDDYDAFASAGSADDEDEDESVDSVGSADDEDDD